MFFVESYVILCYLISHDSLVDSGENRFRREASSGSSPALRILKVLATCESNSMVESLPSKQVVAGSSPVSRFYFTRLLRVFLF